MKPCPLQIKHTLHDYGTLHLPLGIVYLWKLLAYNFLHHAPKETFPKLFASFRDSKYYYIAHPPTHPHTPTPTHTHTHTHTQGERDTCHSEYPELAASPDFVLEEEEGEEHEQATVMDHPPHVYGAFHVVLVARKPVNALGHQNGKLLCWSNTDGVWKRNQWNTLIFEGCIVHHWHTHTLVSKTLTNEDAPGSLLPPCVWPGDDHCVVLHTTEASRLNAVWVEISRNVTSKVCTVTALSRSWSHEP